MAEPGVEEPRIVGPHLTPCGIEGDHLGGVLRGNAHALCRQQQIEVLGFEHDAVAGLGYDRLPEVSRLVLAHRPEIDEAAIALGPVPDRIVVALQEVEAQPETPAWDHLSAVSGLPVAVQDRIHAVCGADLGVRDVGVALHEAQLVEGQTRARHHRERPRHDLEVQRALVPDSDVVELPGAVGDHAGEHIESAGRALRIRPRSHATRQVQRLAEPDQVGAVPLEDRAVVQRDGRTDHERPHLVLDRVVLPGQEAAAQPERGIAQREIDACRLELRFREVWGIDDPGLDGFDQPCVGPDPRFQGFGKREVHER